MKTKNFIQLVVVLFIITVCSNCERDPALSPFGTWTAASITLGGNTATDVSITFNAGGTFLETYWAGGSQWAIAGTFASATMPSDTVLSFTITSSPGGMYTAPVGTVIPARYSNLTESTMDWYEDIGTGFEGPFVLTRM